MDAITLRRLNEEVRKQKWDDLQKEEQERLSEEVETKEDRLQDDENEI